MNELVDELKLKERVVRDILDLILTVEIDAKDDILADVECGGFALGVDDEGRLCAPLRHRVGRPLRGPDLDQGPPAAQVVIEQLLDRLLPRLVVMRVWHSIESVPDGLEHARLAGAAPTD